MSEYIREYAVRHPSGAGVITVPDNSRENAMKMKALIPKTVILTRTVSEWVEE